MNELGFDVSATSSSRNGDTAWGGGEGFWDALRILFLMTYSIPNNMKIARTEPITNKAMAVPCPSEGSLAEDLVLVGIVVYVDVVVLECGVGMVFGFVGTEEQISTLRK